VGEIKKIEEINIKHIIRSQNNKIVKHLPNFIIKKINKSFHIDEINEIIRNNQDKYGFDFVQGCVDHLNIKAEVIDDHLIPKKGRFIFAANHSLGAVDFGAVIGKIHEKFKDIKIIANDLFLHVENTKDIFLPVDTFKNTEKDKKDAIEDHLSEEDTQLFIFPSGVVARKVKGKMDDGKWHRSFIRNAIEHQRDIIPVFIGGTNSKRFYTLANLRKSLHIKANLELFLLPGEVFKKRNAVIPVVFGSPISYTLFDESKTHLEWAAEMKKVVYNLGKQHLLY
jgi:1-acyl-sn-glycerol-3-phosphate acyltransferase